MAWEARLGLKPAHKGSSTLIATWLNGLGSPSGIETIQKLFLISPLRQGLNGLGSPSGIETALPHRHRSHHLKAKWPGKPVWD